MITEKRTVSALERDGWIESPIPNPKNNPVPSSKTSNAMRDDDWRDNTLSNHVYELVSNADNRLLIYVCTPYSGNKTNNIRQAQSVAAKLIVNYNVIPIASHLILDCADGLVNEMVALECAMQLVSMCDIIYVATEYQTPGMVLEIKHAEAKGIPVCHSFMQLEAQLKE